MAQQTINVGAAPNDGTGTPLRTAFQYTNSNFSELYTAVGPSGNNIVVPGSATITGDLTVDTSTLKVDSANNRVGILTASPTHTLDVRGIIKSNGTYTAYVNPNFTGAAAIQTESAESLILAPSGQESLRCAPSGVYTFGDGAGGTRMTLNSTGLGVGVSPAAGDGSGVFKAAGTGSGATNTRIGLDVREITSGNAAGIWLGAMNNENTGVIGSRTASGNIAFQTFNGASWGERMRIDYLGNVGIGVTPSAWTTYSALQIRNGSIANYSPTQDLRISSNAYYASGVWKRIAAAYATQYLLDGSSGIHQWYVAATGAADSTITTFTTAAMTLDASGNLLLATTTNSPSARQYINQTSGSNPALYIAGGASTTPLINFNGAGRMRSDGQYLVMETTNASGVIYVTANTNGVYLSVGGTSWTANSDERLKDIIEPISNAVSKVGSLRSVIGKFKNDETNTRRSFLIAQDVQAVLPEAVDASNPEKLGVAYTEVIPLLVAAIKELTARVQTLETR